jgi:hypothetical protein
MKCSEFSEKNDDYNYSNFSAAEWRYGIIAICQGEKKLTNLPGDENEIEKCNLIPDHNFHIPGM